MHFVYDIICLWGEDMEKICIKCGREFDLGYKEKYCGSCGTEITEKRDDFIRKTCQICGKPVYGHKNSSHFFCDYHWDIYDANDGWN